MSKQILTSTLDIPEAMDARTQEITSDKLYPKCLVGSQQFAVDNMGHLIPCCQCDSTYNLKDKNYIEFLKYVKIEDYESIEEILLSDAWLLFEENLKNNQGFRMCHRYCATKDTSFKKEVTYIGKEIVRQMNDGELNNIPRMTDFKRR
jgi:hypothetical protein